MTAHPTGSSSARSTAGASWLAAALRDGWRSLRRRPGTPLAATVLLALGLASAATMLTLVDTYLLRALPFPDPGRIHTVAWDSDDGERTPRGVDPADWAGAGTGVVGGAAWDLDAFTLLGGLPEIVLGAWVDPGFFTVAGWAPALGRVFTEDDLRRGDASVAVISHELWQRRFEGRPDVVGESFGVFMSDRPDEPEQLTVIGVMPEDFWWVNPYTHVLAPLTPGWVPRMVRLDDGVAAGDAAAQLERLSRAADPSLPESFTVRLEPLQERYAARLEPLLRGLTLATVFVLLVACGNSLLLLLVRASRRERELAVHAALAGGWGRASRLLLGEAVLVGVLAGTAALAIALLALRLLAPHLERQLGRVPPGGVDGVVPGVATFGALGAATLAIVAILWILPIAVLRRRDLSATLRGAAAASTTPRGARRLRGVVLAAEIAFTLALLVAGGLAVHSALDLERREIGHHRQGVLTAGVGLRQGSYPTAAEQLAFGERLLEGLSGLPGVRQAAIAAGSVLREMNPRAVFVEGREADPEPTTGVGVRAVSPSYFATLGIPLRAGRTFDAADRVDAAPVAVISQDLASRLWPDAADPVGRRLRLGGSASAMAMHEEGGTDTVWRTVVGVVGSVRETVIGKPLPEVYLPFAQSPARWIALAVATEGEPESLVPTVAEELRRLDPTLPLYAATSVDRLLADERAPSRFLAALLGAFSLFALALGTAGVYGVIAHGVSQRLREVAIRLSVGADRSEILRLFLGETARLLVVGLLAGGGAGLLLVRSLESRLHGVAGFDPPTWLAVAVLLVVAALAATWIPARRAAGSDPARLLNGEA